MLFANLPSVINLHTNHTLTHQHTKHKHPQKGAYTSIKAGASDELHFITILST